MAITALFSYNQASEGAAELAKALGIPRIKHSGSKFRGNASKTLINWGASSDRFPTDYLSCQVLNAPTAIDNACDKVRSFNLFRQAGVSIPEFTTDRSVALQWLEAGSMVFARTQLRAHSGRGIVIMDPDHPDTWEGVSAPLFVKYIPKKHEYRVHIFRGEIIDIQRKGLRADLQGTEGINYKIRNLMNGFIYVRNDENGVPLLTSTRVPQVVKTVGIAAVQALNLDFGAADVILNERQGTAFALETNCAPGITNSTVETYRQAFSQI